MHVGDTLRASGNTQMHFGDETATDIRFEQLPARARFVHPIQEQHQAVLLAHVTEERAGRGVIVCRREV